MERIVRKTHLGDDEPSRDVAYWMSRPPQERFEAVEELRRQMHGAPSRLQRVVRIIQQKQG